MDKASGEKKRFTWTDDGTILVLALYKKFYLIYLDNKILGKKVQNIIPSEKICAEYDYLIRNLPDENGFCVNQKASESHKRVKNKFSDFQFLNGLDRRNGWKNTKRDERVWNDFKDEIVGERKSEKGKLEQEVERILALIDSVVASRVKIENPIEYDVEGYVIEGKEIIRKHKFYERNPKIVKQKKEEVKREKDFLACEVCEFNFAKTYGSHGEDFIECHHKNPVAQRGKSSETALDDLALVCSNCHRMIHRKRDCLTIEQLKERIAKTNLNKSKQI